MSLSDILTLVISGFALVFSLASFVFTVLTGPRLKLLIGENIILSHAWNSALNVNANFTFFNGGATPGAIVELSGTISPVNGGKKVPIEWQAFLESRNIAGPAEKVRYRDVIQGHAGTIVVTSRAVGGVETKFVGMHTTEQLELSKGDYKLEFHGLIGPKLTARCKGTVILKITEQDAVLLLSKMYRADPSTLEIPRILTFTRQRPYRRSLVSRLLGSDQVFVSKPVAMPNIPSTTEIKPSESQRDLGSVVSGLPPLQEPSHTTLNKSNEDTQGV